MKQIRRILAFMIALVTLPALFLPVYAAGEVAPRYNNVVSVQTTATVSSSGLLVVRHQMQGTQGVTIYTDITTKVEKKTLGLFWTEVDIGTTNNVWTIHVGSYIYDGTRQCQLSSTGTYRITSTYVVTGTGGAADTITSTYQVTYK